MHRLIAVSLIALVLVGAGCGGGGGGAPGGGAPTGWSNFQLAALVLGQSGYLSGQINQGGAVAADTMSIPGRCGAGGNLYVADFGNNRVLCFATPPTSVGQAADFALGQPSLTTSAGGNGAAQLSSPSDVLAAGGRLIVSDSGNNRVLIWNTPPTTNATPADVVVGQPGFNSSVSGNTQTQMDTPYGAVVAGGKLFVADMVNSRVLIYNTVPTVNGAAADVVVGQSNFSVSSGGTSQTRLSFPRSLWSDGTRLVVADMNNNRVMIWNTIPTTNGAPADLVVGQPNFGTNTAGAGALGLESPRSVFSNGTHLFVADTGNARVLIYPFPTANQTAATTVIGQSDFVHTAPNDADQDGTSEANASPRTLRAPGGVFVTGKQLWVTDGTNSRVLLFEGS